MPKNNAFAHEVSFDMHPSERVKINGPQGVTFIIFHCSTKHHNLLHTSQFMKPVLVDDDDDDDSLYLPQGKCSWTKPLVNITAPEL